MKGVGVYEWWWWCVGDVCVRVRVVLKPNRKCHKHDKVPPLPLAGMCFIGGGGVT